MLILLSPAKDMRNSLPEVMLPATVPQFCQEAEFLAAQMRCLSQEDLEKQLKINSKLGSVNYERYQSFSNAPSLQALLAYNGSVFKHIHPEGFTTEDFLYAQDHLRIISTLYGIVRPLDKIKAYRMAYKLKLNKMKEGNVYHYWQPKLTLPLIDDIKRSGGLLVNLASLDVLPSLQMKLLEKEVYMVIPEFKELRKGTYQTVRTYAKMARGEMTHYILKNRIQQAEELKNFNWGGFCFNEQLSDSKNYIFIK